MFCQMREVLGHAPLTALMFAHYTWSITTKFLCSVSSQVCPVMQQYIAMYELSRWLVFAHL